MPLAMSRPWKHPDSVRRAVPADLRELFGKREEKQSLKTKDAALAKQRHAQLLSEVEARWANLRQGPRSLSEAEARAIAAAWQDRWIELHRDNPAEQTWPTSLGEAMWMDDLGERKPVQKTIYEWERVIRHGLKASRISSDDTGDLEPVSCR